MAYAWQVKPEYTLDRPMHAWTLLAEGEVDLMYVQAMESDATPFIKGVLAEREDVVNG